MTVTGVSAKAKSNAHWDGVRIVASKNDKVNGREIIPICNTTEKTTAATMYKFVVIPTCQNVSLWLRAARAK